MQQDRVRVAGETPQMAWVPWHVHGSLGSANNSFAYVYLVILLFFSFRPAATPTTAATMNYSVLVTGFFVCFQRPVLLVLGEEILQRTNRGDEQDLNTTALCSLRAFVACIRSCLSRKLLFEVLPR